MWSGRDRRVSLLEKCIVVCDGFRSTYTGLLYCDDLRAARAQYECLQNLHARAIFQRVARDDGLVLFALG